MLLTASESTGGIVNMLPLLLLAMLLLSGIQMLCIGIVGQYLAKTYLETKKRPIYLVGETNLDQARKENGKALAESVSV